MSHRLTPGLVLLRAAAVLALMLLLWNPARSRALPEDAQPLVLLDASLSMAGQGGAWRAALDTARVLAAKGSEGGGVIWRFGGGVAGFDSAPPGDGASRLGPALEAAAARGGAITVVTDGAVEDVADLPPDLRRRPRVVLLPRDDFPDAFVAGVAGPRRVSAQDTVRLSIAYGTAGKRERGSGKRATLVVSAGRRLASRDVTLPDSGTVSAELTLPASRFPFPGWHALEVRLVGTNDPEPRDDARLFLIEVSPLPAAVILAAPPDWETRFLARALGEVARVPVKTFVEAEPARGWRDGATLAAVAVSDVQRAVDAARLVVLAGDPARHGRIRLAPRAAVLAWPTTRGREGDWYVQPPPPSPLAGLLAGLPWDSLPPASSAVDLLPDSSAIVVLTARLARRGTPQPIVLLTRRDGGGARQATVAASGLWRWSFRGGAAGLAYRSFIASLADWLLGGGEGRGERFVPVALETPNGLPLVWRWTGMGSPQDVRISLQAGPAERVDTVRFDADGRAELRLPPGVYRYAADDGGERGLVAVETYSAEWRPAAAVLTAQAGLPAERRESVGLRDRWWLFVIAVAAFAAEWAWRRRMGLP